MNVSSGYRKNGFDAYGGTYLQKSDMAHWMHSPARTDPGGVCLELGEEVEDVEPGFFALLPTIDELWILHPACRVTLTAADAALFRRNNVLVRGAFHTAAERFAQTYRLRFLHIDTVLARAGDYFEYGVNIATLRFYDDGSAYMHQDCRCQGSSAGSTGGGEISFDLPKDFYVSMSAEDVADICWGCFYGPMLQKGVLADLMNKAKAKNGFLQDYTN